MAEYDQLAAEAEAVGSEIFWLGGVNQAEVQRLEKLISLNLPTSFKRFLLEYGGGDVVGAEVSGIEDGDASIESGGTVLGDTNQCRKLFGLPSDLVVIYFHDNEVCWCLDTARLRDGECPVVSGSMPFPVEIDRSTNVTIGGSIPLLCSSTQT